MVTLENLGEVISTDVLIIGGGLGRSCGSDQGQRAPGRSSRSGQADYRLVGKGPQSGGRPMAHAAGR